MTIENNNSNVTRTRLLNSAVLRCNPKSIEPLLAEFSGEQDKAIRQVLSELSYIDSRIAKLFEQEEKILQRLAERSKTMTARSRATAKPGKVAGELCNVNGCEGELKVCLHTRNTYCYVCERVVGEIL